MKVSTIIVNFRTPELVIQCLKSLNQNESNEFLFDIYIIDNNSADGSVEVIRSGLSGVLSASNVFLHAHTDNDGFSSGNNIGINYCDGEFILLLNSDAIIRPNTIQLLVQSLIDNPDSGIASPRLEWPDGRPQESCFRFHRPINELIRSACTGPITRLLKRFEVPLSVTDEISHPEWTSFACVLIRKEVFEQIGLLDEEFFMYFEDVDFCRRARAAGWNIVHNPEARVVHLRGGSSPVKSQVAKKKRLPRYFYESRARYYYKYFGRSGLLAANLFWHLGWCVARVRGLFSPSYQSNICERQWLDIWTNFSDPTAPYIHPDNY